MLRTTRRASFSSFVVDSRESVYLSIGSNLGDRFANIVEAYRGIGRILSTLRTSSVYETKPLYVTDQPMFLNSVVCGFATYSPLQLLHQVLEIEGRLGRSRFGTISKGARKIDIDILLFGEQIVDTDELVIPHIGLEERQFVLIPLLELSPDIRNPVTHSDYRESLVKVGDQGVRYFSSASPA